MKKIFVFICIAVISISAAIAQGSLPKGATQLNTGLGFSGWGVPVYIGFDYGVHPDISIGAEFSFRSYREDWHGDKYSHSVIGIAGNANYHFNTLLSIPSEWDFYAGLNLGFYIWNSPNDYPGDHVSGLGLGAQIGGRYYFNNRIGLNLEIGGGTVASDGKIGITVKL